MTRGIFSIPQRYLRSSFLLRESEIFLLSQIANSSCLFIRLSNISNTFSIPENLYIPPICQRPSLSIDISEIVFIRLIYQVSYLFLRDSKISSIVRYIIFFFFIHHYPETSSIIQVFQRYYLMLRDVQIFYFPHRYHRSSLYLRDSEISSITQISSLFFIQPSNSEIFFIPERHQKFPLFLRDSDIFYIPHVFKKYSLFLMYLRNILYSSDTHKPSTFHTNLRDLTFFLDMSESFFLSF